MDQHLSAGHQVPGLMENINIIIKFIYLFYDLLLMHGFTVVILKLGKHHLLL